METHTLQLGNFVTVYIHTRAPFSFHSGHWVETAVLWENAPPAQSFTHCMIHTLRWPEAFFSPPSQYLSIHKKGVSAAVWGNYVLIWWNEWWAAIKKNTATPRMKASGLQATWLIVSWMRADVHKLGNDRWTHPPLINICNWIMRLNSAHTPSESSALKEIEKHAFIHATYLRHGIKSASGNGLMGFKGRFSAAAMEFQNTICHLGRRRLCINGSVFLSAPASWRRNMEKKLRMSQVFSETPEIQLWRYECHFRICCLEIKWTDSGNWGVGTWEC